MEPLTRYAEAVIPTDHGPLNTVVYRWNSEEHLALVCGDVRGQVGVLARVHSECWTGETLGSRKCDCRDQLDQALRAITAAGCGVVVYLRQEGRGIGLGNKIRAYALQAQGKDTVEANEALGFAPDLRSYEQAAAILRDLGVTSVALMTNNPEKLEGLAQAGVTIDRHVPHWVDEHDHNRGYLEVKRQKMGHLDADGKGKP